MRQSDVTNGVVVNVKIDGEEVQGIVEGRDGNMINISLPDQYSVRLEEFNLTWSVLYEMAYPSIGKISKGSNIRLGRPLGKQFIPGEDVLFADGFKKIDDSLHVIGRNLNKNLYRELSFKDYGKKWIIEKKKTK